MASKDRELSKEQPREPRRDCRANGVYVIRGIICGASIIGILYWITVAIVTFSKDGNEYEQLLDFTPEWFDYIPVNKSNVWKQLTLSSGAYEYFQPVNGHVSLSLSFDRANKYCNKLNASLPLPDSFADDEVITTKCLQTWIDVHREDDRVYLNNIGGILNYTNIKLKNASFKERSYDEFVAVALPSCWYSISKRLKGFFLCMRNKRSDDMSRNHHLITRNIDAEWDGYNEWRERAMNKSFLDYWEVLDIRTEIRLQIGTPEEATGVCNNYGARVFNGENNVLTRQIQKVLAVIGGNQFTALPVLLLNVRWNGNIWVDQNANKEHNNIKWCTNMPQVYGKVSLDRKTITKQPGWIVKKEDSLNEFICVRKSNE